MINSIVSNKADPSKIVYFPSWADGQFLKPVDGFTDKELIANLPKGFYITFAGNIGEGQDIETIIKVAEELKYLNNLHWLFIGYGSMSKWLKTNVLNRGLQKTVHILGKRPLETMPMYYSFSDVLVASLKKNDIYALTLPGKIQTYLASGKPIISMIDGESARIINESKSGFVVPSENTDGLLKAVKNMYKMPKDELNIMGLNGRQYYLKNFDFNQTLKRFNKLYNIFVSE
jgi:colanic acid biosynthesis glycosyl transferase WcaI